MEYSGHIDLHMHSTISDGTDTPEEILEHVRKKQIRIFSVTDHDAIKSSRMIPGYRKEGDPVYITGVEFSCQDEEGKYHILGYRYDPESRVINDLVDYGHSLRIKKVRQRIEFLKKEFGFVFPVEELKALFKLDNPGKPHIGNLMVKYGMAETKDQAISEFINRMHIKNEYLRPEEAITGILGAGGIPVLAHPFFGSGDQLILGEDMKERLRKLMGFGLQGVEAFYSGFTPKLIHKMLHYAKHFDLYVTAGSDYHGRNKLVVLGDTGMEQGVEWPEEMKRFLDAVLDKEGCA